MKGSVHQIHLRVIPVDIRGITDQFWLFKERDFQSDCWGRDSTSQSTPNNPFSCYSVAKEQHRVLH